MSMQNVVTYGSVLKRSNLGEADRLLVLYTEQLGKITAIAKGAKKPKSRLVSHLEPGNIVQFELAPGRTFYIVTAAKIIAHYRFEQLPVMQALFMWLELFERLTHADESNDELFSLLKRGLARLSQSDKSAGSFSIMEIALYSTMGYQLEVDHCIIGREVLKEQGNALTPARGGVVCITHHDKASDAFPISADAIKLLRLIQKGEWGILQKVQISDSLYTDLIKIAGVSRRHVLDRDLKSEFLEG